jgi:transposase InsO family protein
MPWQEVNMTDLRRGFITDWLAGGSVTGLCRVYSISRATAHKLINRYNSDPEDYFVDLSRRPHSCPHETPELVREAVIALRRRYPLWGPKKIIALLTRQHPRWLLPAASTVGDILKRADLIETKEKRRRLGPSPVPGGRGTAPNEVWCVDYKGEFKLRNGAYCFPLTISDEYSRFLLNCQGFKNIRTQDVQGCFEELFTTYGLPQRIRSDNGTPFAKPGIARLSRLSVWWLRLGIQLDRNQPHHPEQNGRHERMHRDLKAFATRPPERTFTAQQRRFDTFKHHHNYERPHEGLEMDFPSEHYHKSKRRYTGQLPAIDYPKHHEVRKVSATGVIKLRDHPIFLSHALAGEYVSLMEQDEDSWDIHFINVPLGRYRSDKKRFIPFGAASSRTEH